MLCKAKVRVRERVTVKIFEKRSARSYDKKAANYNDTAEGRFTYGFNRILAGAVRMPENGRLLDVACGNGRLLKMLRQTYTFEGYGVDISENMVKVASKGNPDMIFKKAPCDDLPFEDAFFDAITVCAAYHHFPNVKAFANEASRVLKPHGKLYIAEVYCPGFWRAVLNPFIRFSPAGDIRFYSPDEIILLLRNVGFECEPVLIEGNVQVVVACK